MQPKANSHQQQASPDPAPPTTATNPHGLFLLRESNLPDNSKDHTGVDIVAIHGLNGNAYTTWKHDNGVLWLRDLLPDAFAGSRVFTYGYSSKVFQSDSAADLRSFSRNLLNLLNAKSVGQQQPIIFICHSLGGIVCKQVRT